MRIALLLVLLVSGCVNPGDVRSGLDTLEDADSALDKIERGVTCARTSFSIASASWDGDTLTVVLQNDGKIELEGFVVRSLSDETTVTTTLPTVLPAGGTATLSVATIDEPREVVVTSEQCPIATERASVAA